MVLVYWLVFINVLAFILYGIDKKKAKDKKWRISEATLITLAVIGGSAGALAGMYIFHHKTRKKKFYITVPAFFVLLVVTSIFCLYQNYHLTTSYHDVDLGLDQDLTIVQVSDLHNQFFGIGQSALLDRIREEAPDMIVVTGDLVDSRHTSYPIAMDFIEGAVEIAPVYYVTGNHEARLAGEKLDSFISEMEQKGVQYIDDKYIDCGEYIIAGISDDSLYYGEEMEPFGGSGTVIMLGHEPQYAQLYKSLGADLVFTGHYHGGQIIIPGVGGLLSPEFEFFPEVYEGIHDYGGMKLIVSRGLGNSVFPVRINNYPEIVVAHIS